MVEHLEAMVATGKCPPGSRIPPLRELCELFDISTGTAVRGIGMLVSRGILEVRHGAGTFVRGRDAEAAADCERRIAVFLVDNDPAQHYCAHALRGVQAAAKRHQCLLQLRFIPLSQMNQSLLQSAAAESDALLLLGNYDPYIRQLPRTVPCIGLEMHNSYRQLCSTLTLDPVDAAESAVAFFQRRGCAKVFLVSHDPPFQKLRADLFELRWREAGGELVRYFCDPYSREEQEAIQVDDPNCGYLFVSGTTCNHVAKRYREATGRVLAADRHILSIDGKSRVVPGYEPMNTIGIDYCAAGRAAFDECMRRLAEPGDGARRIYLAGRLSTYDTPNKKGMAQ